jgi:carbon storage regulator
MLVLGRKVNESVLIDGGVVVTILAVEGDKVKIGIQAPSDVRILRQEVYEAVKQENLRAASLSSQVSDESLSSLDNLLHKRTE